LQNRNESAPLEFTFSVYMRVALDKPYKINLKCYWDHLRSVFGEILRTWELFGNLIGTPWEHDGNTLGEREKTKNPSPHSKKKTAPFMSAH
jgi:hypothetical protein